MSDDKTTYNGVEFCDLSTADKERVNLGILEEDKEDEENYDSSDVVTGCGDK